MLYNLRHVPWLKYSELSSLFYKENLLMVKMFCYFPFIMNFLASHLDRLTVASKNPLNNNTRSKMSWEISTDILHTQQ